MLAKNEPKSPFALALAARRGDIPPESLSGAAKMLFKDNTLTQGALEGYDKPPVQPRPKQVSQMRRMFKRS